MPDPTFTLASFAFEAAVSPKSCDLRSGDLSSELIIGSRSAVKMAKSILSEDRDNLILWDGYARLERQRGNISAARAVYVAALQAARALRQPRESLVYEMKEDEVELWSAWAEMEWEEGEEARCLEVLVLAAEEGIVRLGMCICCLCDITNQSSQKSALTLPIPPTNLLPSCYSRVVKWVALMKHRLSG